MTESASKCATYDASTENPRRDCVARSYWAVILTKTIAFIVVAITTTLILAVALVTAITYFMLIPFAHAMDWLADGTEAKHGR